MIEYPYKTDNRWVLARYMYSDVGEPMLDEFGSGDWEICDQEDFPGEAEVVGAMYRYVKYCLLEAVDPLHMLIVPRFEMMSERWRVHVQQSLIRRCEVVRAKRLPRGKWISGSELPDHINKFLMIEKKERRDIVYIDDDNMQNIDELLKHAINIKNSKRFRSEDDYDSLSFDVKVEHRVDKYDRQTTGDLRKLASEQMFALEENSFGFRIAAETTSSLRENEQYEVIGRFDQSLLIRDGNLPPRWHHESYFLEDNPENNMMAAAERLGREDGQTSNTSGEAP